MTLTNTLSLWLGIRFFREGYESVPLSLWRRARARFWGSARLRDKVLLFLKGFSFPGKAMALMYPAPADSIRIYFYYVVRLRDLLRLFGQRRLVVAET